MLSKKQLNSLKRGNVSTDTEKTKARITEDYMAASAADKKTIRELASAPNFNSVVAKNGTASAKYVAAIAQVLSVSPYYYTGETDEKKPFTGEIMEGFLKKYADSKPATAKPKAVAKKPVAKKPAAKTAKPAIKKATTAKAAPKAKAPKPVKKTAKLVAPKAKIAPAAKKTKSASAAKTTPVKVEAVKPVAVKTPKGGRVPALIPPGKDGAALFTLQLDNSAKMNKAVKDLSEDAAMILLKGLMKRAEASEESAVLCDVVKRCLLS
jgi:hypothetical protein